MNRSITKFLLIFFSVILAAELVFVGYMHLTGNTGSDIAILGNETEPTDAVTVTEEPTEEPTEAATVAPTETEPEETEPEETEPTEQRYVLTFAGDCTLGSTAGKWSSASSFVKTVGDDYDYPFRNVAEYFENDDFTIVNLEGPLTETGTAAAKTFAFKGPTAYTQILTGSSVEGVTLANNHAEDYGKEGYKNTKNALDEVGVHYVEKDSTKLLVTESGLKIGLYAGSFDFSKSDMQNDIAQLRKDGAEIVICAFHWGTEGAYRPNSTQEYFGRAAIEAGADIVYGSHPHVLQKVEEYKDGIIYYSLGNFSFGGSTFPQDYDSAILQQEIIRDVDGKVRLGELTMIPVSVSSINAYNNYQPTPYEEGSKEYDRVISKLDGSFKGPDLVVDYSKLPGATEPTTEPTTGPTEGSTETTPPTTGGDSGSSDGPTGGDTGSSDGPSDGPSGGDSGSSEGPSGTPAPPSDGPSGGDSGSSGGDSGSSGGPSGGDSGSSGGDSGSSGGIGEG